MRLFPNSHDRRARIIAPLSLVYAAAGTLHRNLWLQPKVRDRSHLLPLVVIGGLRAGGSGKTSVVLELARHLSAQGRRVGILVYWLQKPWKTEDGNLKCLAEGLAEVTSESDWRYCSDEAVLLARESGARVFATRNREHAWNLLSHGNGLDVLISDDGLLDARLRGAFRIVLRRPGEAPGLLDLLPAGPYRLTTGILSKVDCIAEGPAPVEESQKFRFQRELVFPEGFNPRLPWWAICGLGNPQIFRRDLLSAGVHLIGMTCGPDHGLPNLNHARAQAVRGNATGFLCTAKDGIKLIAHTEKLPSLTVIGERISLSPDLISVVEGHLLSPSIFVD